MTYYGMVGGRRKGEEEDLDVKLGLCFFSSLFLLFFFSFSFLFSFLFSFFHVCHLV